MNLKLTTSLSTAEVKRCWVVLTLPLYAFMELFLDTGAYPSLQTLILFIEHCYLWNFTSLRLIVVLFVNTGYLWF
jgi:hypothetical protein